MRRIGIVYAVFALWLWAGQGVSEADQAAWIKKSEANRALTLVQEAKGVRSFCAPCGDATWTPVSVQSTAVKKVSDDYFQLFINDQGIDLAYTYIKAGGAWKNLAMETGLSVTDVPPILSDAGGDRPGGETAIDRKLSECLDANPSTAGMVGCMNDAYAAWDKELNAVYKALMEEVDEETKASLKSSQLRWLAYRDEEFKLIEDLYGHFDGTMYQPMIVEDRIKIVRHRVLELAAYADLFQNFETEAPSE